MDTKLMFSALINMVKMMLCEEPWQQALANHLNPLPTTKQLPPWRLNYMCRGGFGVLAVFMVLVDSS